MNPYINSLNGFGGGFIAFWPNISTDIFQEIIRFTLYIKQSVGINFER